MPDSLTIVPAAVQTAVKPKPSRAEIIDAMTHLRVVELAQKRGAALKRRDALELKLRKAIIAQASKTNLSVYGWNTWNDVLEVKLSLNAVTPALLALAKEVNEANAACRISTDFKTVRKQVERDFAGAMDRTERVEALLKDPEAVKALKGALEKIY